MTEIMTKTCSGCKQPLPFDQFHKSKANPDGLQRQCKTCRVSARQTPANLKAVRLSDRLRKQGISEAKVNATLDQREAKCLDCHRPFSADKLPIELHRDKGAIVVLCHDCRRKRVAAVRRKKALDAPARAWVLPTTPPSELAALLKP